MNGTNDAGWGGVPPEVKTSNLGEVDPKGYDRNPEERIAEAVTAIRAGSIHSDSTFHMMKAQEQQLTATEEELRKKAQVIIDEHKDCSRALDLVRRLMSELSS